MCLCNAWRPILHYFFSQQLYIPRETKIVHCVCKDFDTVNEILWKLNF